MRSRLNLPAVPRAAVGGLRQSGRAYAYGDSRGPELSRLSGEISRIRCYSPTEGASQTLHHLGTVHTTTHNSAASHGFGTRQAAGRRPATRLIGPNTHNAFVIAITNGAIPVGDEIARVAHAPIEEFRHDRPMEELIGRTVILVDDGLATQDTLLSAIATVRELGVNRIVLAVPVISPDISAVVSRDTVS